MSKKAKASGPGSVEYMIEEIRRAMMKCTVPEKECYEALVDEASGWEARLQELEEEESDEQ